MSFERPNIEKMQGYAPGEQRDGSQVIKLNTNENPYPASPQVEAALRAIQIESLRRYPPPLANTFRTVAAKLHGVATENIIPTNGGDELLRLLLTTYVDTDETIVISQPSYSLYPVLAEIRGCKLLEIPLRDDWAMPDDFLDSLLKSNAKMCILVNPHAPTGALLTDEYLAQLAAGFAGILVIDEAYVDFVDPGLAYDAVPLVKAFDNVLILRSLSKGYSLAGLRFGYGVGATSLLNPMLYKTRDSYNTDTVSQHLAIAALESVAYARDTWAKVRESRTSLSKALNELGLATSPSQTNFVLCQVPKSIGAQPLYLALKERNILVRHFDQHRLQDALRISIGSDSENGALLEAIQQIIGS